MGKTWIWNHQLEFSWDAHTNWINDSLKSSSCWWVICLSPIMGCGRCIPLSFQANFNQAQLTYIFSSKCILIFFSIRIWSDFFKQVTYREFLNYKGNWGQICWKLNSAAFHYVAEASVWLLVLGCVSYICYMSEVVSINIPGSRGSSRMRELLSTHWDALPL